VGRDEVGRDEVGRVRRRRWRVVVLALAGVYFLLPLFAAAEFCSHQQQALRAATDPATT